MKNIYSVYWLWKYIAPLFLLYLFIDALIGSPNLFNSTPFPTTIFFFFGFFISIDFYTRKYEICEDSITLSRFFILRKSYKLSEIALIEFPKDYDVGIGLNYTVVHFKNEKKLTVYMLGKPKEFRQSLNRALEGLHEAA